MAAALVCLLMVTLVGAALVQASLSQHRRAVQRARRLQALWLAESAASRAHARLQASADYRGETWRVEGKDMGKGYAAGTAVIRLESTEDGDRIVIEARYGDDPLRRAVHRKVVELEKIE